MPLPLSSRGLLLLLLLVPSQFQCSISIDIMELAARVDDKGIPLHQRSHFRLSNHLCCPFFFTRIASKT
uniref:Putative secreted peptide n=1 Tax=Anopheles braziliensis TaxID=58242 RepID=A0A2M3ZS10_9DIPT